ncbi:MAG: hypothetical protein ACI85O_003050 [Saprospiraceae bacterium]|jgi:hypothetical protein
MKYAIILSFLLTTCNNQSTIPPQNLDALCQCWKYSYEESEDDIKVYRPCGYNFPLSRGREGMDFAADKTFIYNAIAPTDGFTKLKGNWTLEEDTLTMNYTTPNTKRSKLVIISLTKEMMKLKNK